jgi:antitoxin (DNA-binding transcriptional repressor) of toxin-antitoxin stability system
MLTISKSKLKAQMLQIFRQIEESGEEVVVTDRNRPVLRIQAIKQRLSVEDAFADVYGQLVFLEDPNTPTIEEWGDLIP